MTMATGQAEPLIAQEAHPLAGGAALQKRLDDQRHRMRPRPVRSVHAAAIVLAHQPGREGQGQGAARRLLRHARAQAAAHGVALHLAPHPLHAQQEPALGGRGIVDAVAIGNQALSRGTQSEPGLPIGAVAGEAGALIAQHDADLSQGHLGQQRLRAVTTRGALGRASPIRCDHFAARIGPPQVAGMRAHGGRALLALGGGQPWMAGGRPQGEDGFAPEMRRVSHRGRRQTSPR